MSFVVIEGPNGAGKTTLIKRLSEQGYRTLSSPNGTPLAKMIRPACRGADQWNDLDEMVKFLLFSAARYDEFKRLVENKKDIIICDRWHFSTWVYQCQLGNIPVSLYEATIPKEEKIDKVIILGGDPEVLINRVIAEREKNQSHGICSWTKEKETMIRINQIYDTDLPNYLKYRKIPCIKIDTTNMTIDSVEYQVKHEIDKI